MKIEPSNSWTTGTNTSTSAYYNIEWQIRGWEQPPEAGVREPRNPIKPIAPSAMALENAR